MARVNPWVSQWLPLPLPLRVIPFLPRGKNDKGYLRVYKGIKGLQGHRSLHGLCTILITCRLIIDTLNTTHDMF
jgi:hypothetical protein